MKRTNSKKVLLNERDAAIFEFTWRWKLVTTNAIAERFFGSAGLDTTYNRLLRLKNDGYLKLRALDLEGRKFVWAMSPKGFELIKEHLPELKDEFFGAENIEHDHLVSAVHLGDWLVQKPESVELFSDQELRCYHFEHYPNWVPKTDFHRPDGYWRVPYKNEMMTIALEVELSPKLDKRYRLVAEFYQKNSDISRVVWVVRTRGMGRSIQEKFQSVVKSEALIHNFILRSDFETVGWQARIVLGHESGRTLAFALGVRELTPMQEPMQHPMQEPMQHPMQCPCSRMVTALLDTRKRPSFSTSSAPSNFSQFAYRMAFGHPNTPYNSEPIQAPSNSHSTPPISPLHRTKH